MKIHRIYALIAVALLSHNSTAHDAQVQHCNSLLATQTDPLNMLDHQSAQVGTLPGPSEHYRMKNVNFEVIPAKGVPGFDAKIMRGRFWRMGAGGVIADHCHENRPAMVYLLSGIVRETKRGTGGTIITQTLSAGDIIAEGNGTRHWWVNEGQEPVTMFAVDFPNENLPSAPAGDYTVPFYFNVEMNNDMKNGEQIVSYDDNKVTEKIFEKSSQYLDLGKEYPFQSDLEDYVIRARLLTVSEGAVVGLNGSKGLPSISYVRSGAFAEFRTDQKHPIWRGKKSHSSLPYGERHVWKFLGLGTGELIVIEFSRKLEP